MLRGTLLSCLERAYVVIYTIYIHAGHADLVFNAGPSTRPRQSWSPCARVVGANVMSEMTLVLIVVQFIGTSIHKRAYVSFSISYIYAYDINTLLWTLLFKIV